MQRRDEPVRVELVPSHGALRSEVAKGLIALAITGAVLGVQWWATTPEPERRVQLHKLGLCTCRFGRWHWRGGRLWWRAERCLCAWPENVSPESQRRADLAEERAMGAET